MTAAGASADASSVVERLATQALLPVGADGGGVTLVTATGDRATVCATDPVARRIEDLQLVLGEGPCVDAAVLRSPVLVGDLRDAGEGVQERWPVFLAEASAAGVRAVFAFPLRIGAIALGAMDLYRRSPGPLSPPQLTAALLTADAVSLVLLDVRTEAVGAAGPVTGLRLPVHNAAGMAMVQLGTTIEHALVRLRGVAYAEERPIDEVAADVIAGRLRFRQEDA